MVGSLPFCRQNYFFMGGLRRNARLAILWGYRHCAVVLHGIRWRNPTREPADVLQNQLSTLHENPECY